MNHTVFIAIIIIAVAMLWAAEKIAWWEMRRARRNRTGNRRMK